MTISGRIFGYDPGGNNCHGVALLNIDNGKVYEVNIQTFSTAEQVIRYLEDCGPIIGLGVDTLTCWSTGESGWRPADRWLRGQYSEVRNSIVTPNGLYGAMALNGMAVLFLARNINRELFITETHPKVLYWSLTQQRYSYKNHRDEMDRWLSGLLGKPLKTNNAHEWDAAFSAYAAFKSLTQGWTTDLHDLPKGNDERIVYPCGAKTFFVWPE
jgi:hypothetical protein